VTTLEDIITEANLERAFAWLCRRRTHFPADADVWSFRLRWPADRAGLRRELLAGRFRFALLSRRTLKGGEEVDIWSARDALVLKCLALGLREPLGISPRCYHLKGAGGSKHALTELLAALPAHEFVFRTDVASYYASIDHDRLLGRLAAVVTDPRILTLIAQYLMCSAERGGDFWHYRAGIALGCPLSPLVGAFFLAELDRHLERAGVFFVRYMDDVAILTRTRGQLRSAVKAVNQSLTRLGLTKHPRKTFVGRIAKGFDFLGYHLSRAELGVAETTLAAYRERARQLYEQEPGSAVRSPALAPRHAPPPTTHCP